MTYSAPLGVSVWRSPVQTQASPQALVPSAVACSVPFPQHRWRNWDSEDTGHVQAPETPAASCQDSTRPCSHTHLLCPAQDVGFCPRASWDTPPSLSVTAGKRLGVTLPFLISPRGLTRSGSQPFRQSPRPTLSTGAPAQRMTTAYRSLWPQGEDAASVTRLEPSLLSSAGITGWPVPRNLPARRNQTHRCAAHAQDPEGLWE